MTPNIPLPPAYVLRSHDPMFGGAISYMLIGMIPPKGVLPKISKPTNWDYGQWIDGRNAWLKKLPADLPVYEHIGKKYETKRTAGELAVFGVKKPKAVKVVKVD